MSPEVIQVIQSDIKRGEGTTEDVVRRVLQYHTTKGEFLAELDPCALKTIEPIPLGWEASDKLREEMLKDYKKEVRKIISNLPEIEEDGGTMVGCNKKFILYRLGLEE